MKLKTLTGLSVSLTMLAAVAAGAAVLPMAQATQAERRVVAADDDFDGSLGDFALEAGSRSAILAYCGIDGAAIEFVFNRKLETSGISQTARRALWQSYGTARSSAAAVLARSGMTECGGAYSLLKETIHDLNRPVSQWDPENPAD